MKFKPPTERSDRRLLQAARTGHPDAFAVFYRRYRQLVLTYFRRRVRQPELAADLTMEVFSAALIATHREDGDEPDDPAAWLFGIAHNKLVDTYRRGVAEDHARRQLELERVCLDDDDIARVDALTEEHRVLELLDELPHEQREAVRARILHDRTYADIAVEIGTSELVVRKRVSRGLQQLQTTVEKGK